MSLSSSISNTPSNHLHHHQNASAEVTVHTPDVKQPPSEAEAEAKECVEDLSELPPSEKHDPDVAEASGPPDGGWDAWLTVLGATLVSFGTFGYVTVSINYPQF